MKPLQWLVLPLVAVLLAAGGCKKDSDEPAATYTVRGVLKQMPDDSGRIYIHHEAIPEFIDQSGAKMGMPSMTMPFAVAPDVSLESLAAGDKVEFTFAVYWKRDTTAHVTSIHKLPEDTPIELSGR